LLTAGNLAIMAGVVVLWAGSHVVGVGAIVDLILLGAGAVAFGWSVFEGAEELYNFATTATAATSEQDLDKASSHFANAVLILGLAAIQAVLLRGQAGSVRANLSDRANFKPLPRVKLPPSPVASRELSVSRVNRILPRKRGETDPFGRIKIARYHAQTAAPYSLEQKRATLYHELVHRYLSPKTGALLRLRAEAKISSYFRIAFLRYLEEALAQGYAMLRVYGLEKALAVYRFPIENGYVKVSQLIGEGSLIGTIMLGGTRFYVTLHRGRIANDEVEIKATDEVQPSAFQAS
jgi:hypothetical protein